MNGPDIQPSLRVVEVGLRDGLQTVPKVLTTDEKLLIVDRLLDAGAREIEVASFAHPKVLPQLGDAEAVLAGVPRPPGVSYRALVPNLRGAERAAECEVDVLVALVSCDDEVSRINQGMPTAAAVQQLPAIGRIAESIGAELSIGLAMAFFAPCAGPMDPIHRASVVARVVDAGARSVYFADTVGMAHPRQVAEVLTTTREAHPDLQVGLHLHARNGFALANAYTALTLGVDWLESSFCGLGGDLWFPGAPEVLGNLATEDLLLFAEAIGVSTGVDRTAYRAVSELAAALTEEAPRDHLTRGGAPEELAAMTWDEIMAGFSGRTTVSERGAKAAK